VCVCVCWGGVFSVLNLNIECFHISQATVCQSSIADEVYSLNEVVCVPCVIGRLLVCVH